MIYLPYQLERFRGGAEDSVDKVDEYFMAMLQYHIDEQALIESAPNAIYAEQGASRDRWNARKQGFEFTKPTPCFKKIAVQSGVDLNDDMTCYLIAATKTCYLLLDAFMECVVVDLFSEENLFYNPNLEYPFWHSSFFLYLTSESTMGEWEGLMGVAVPRRDATNDDLTELRNGLDVVLKPAFDNYVDAWVKWLRHYADKTNDFETSLTTMISKLRNNPRLVKMSTSEEESINGFHVGPAYEPEESITLQDLFANAMNVNTPQVLWQKVRDLAKVRPYAFAFMEAAAQTAEERRIERCNNGEVEDWWSDKLEKKPV